MRRAFQLARRSTLSIVTDIAAEALERVTDLALGKWLPRWARWLVVASFFALLLLWPSAPAWLRFVAETVWGSLVFSSTVGLVFGTYARKLGDEGRGSLGFFITSLLLFGVMAMLLPSLAKPPTETAPFILPGPGYLLGLALTMVDGAWSFGLRTRSGAGGSSKREPWHAWSLRATVLGGGAVATLAAAVIAGAPFLMRELPPGDPWFAGWGAGFGAYGTVVSALQLVDVRAGTQAVESSRPGRMVDRFLWADG